MIFAGLLSRGLTIERGLTFQDLRYVLSEYLIADHSFTTIILKQDQMNLDLCRGRLYRTQYAKLPLCLFQHEAHRILDNMQKIPDALPKVL